MARREAAFSRLEEHVLDLVDLLFANAQRDGVIDADEQQAIDRAQFVARELERGNLARLRAQQIENSWALVDSPHTQRRIRELLQDIGPSEEPLAIA